MTDLTVTAALVAPIFDLRGKAEIYDFIAAEDIDPGEALYINSSGDVALADADLGGAGGAACQFRGIALTEAGTGQAVSMLMHGPISGFTLTTPAYDDVIYLSATAGALSAEAPGTNNVIVGRVFPLSDTDTSGNPTKVLFIDVDMAAADHSGT